MNNHEIFCQFTKILTAVTWKVSMQALESSVEVGPAVVKDSKSNLSEQTSVEKWISSVKF